MNKYIYALMESYFDSTQQMNKILKKAKALEKAEQEAKDNRIEFIQGVLGKTTYNKYYNKGTFAPVPLSAVRLMKKDFIALSPEEDAVRIDKLIERLQLKYYRNEFSFVDDGYGEYNLKTDIVFRTIDEIIDFFYNILNIYVKLFKTDDIQWKRIVRKFRLYL